MFFKYNIAIFGAKDVVFTCFPLTTVSNLQIIMSAQESSEIQAARAVSLVNKIKEVSQELVLATSIDDPVNKYCFDGAIAERVKILECAKEKYYDAAKEFDHINEQLKTAKKRFDSINMEYLNMQEQNKVLNKSIESEKCEEKGEENNFYESSDSRLRLSMYKKLTGLYFDLDSAENNLVGFVAIKGDKNHHSGLAPFAFKKDEPDITSSFWGKIKEVLQEVPDGECNTTIMDNKF